MLQYAGTELIPARNEFHIISRTGMQKPVLRTGLYLLTHFETTKTMQVIRPVELL